MRVLLLHAVTPTIPMGVLAIADALERAGHAPRIVHAGLERAAQGDVRTGALLGREERALVGVVLHWAHQSLAAKELCEEVRRASPRSFIVAGGLTASAFPAEVLEEIAALDGVVRGEGEGPMVALAAALEESPDAPDLSRVPGLVWRAAPALAAAEVSRLASQGAGEGRDRGAEPARPPDGPSGATPSKGRRRRGALPLVAGEAPAGPRSSGAGLVTNALAEPPASEALGALRFARADLVARRPLYLGLDLFPGRLTPPVFLLCTARGCTVNCAACGGGRTAHEELSGRLRFAERPHESVLADLRAARAQGHRSFYVCNDPRPNGPYFFELFERIEREGLGRELELGFGCWGLPRRDFLEAARRSFDRVFLEISPETASEALRARIRGFSYTNAALEEALRHVEALDLTAEVYFGFPAAGETIDDLRATRAYANRLARAHTSRVGVNVLALSTDPHSPLARDPAGHGVTLRARGFGGYLRALAEDRERFPPSGRAPWLANHLLHRPAAIDERDIHLAALAATTEAALRARRPRLLFGAIDALGGEDAFEVALERALAPVLDAHLGRLAREGVLLVDDAEIARQGVRALCEALLAPSFAVGPAPGSRRTAGASNAQRTPGLAAALADVARVALAREDLLTRLHAPAGERRDAAGPSMGAAWFRAGSRGAEGRSEGLSGSAGGITMYGAGREQGPVAREVAKQLGVRARLRGRPYATARLETLDPADADPRIGGSLGEARRGAGPTELMLLVDADGREWGLERSAEAERVISACDGTRTRADVARMLAREGVEDADAWIDELMTYGGIEPVAT